MATGYCLKCKEQREIKGAEAITMKNGKPATTGTSCLRNQDLQDRESRLAIVRRALGTSTWLGAHRLVTGCRRAPEPLP